MYVSVEIHECTVFSRLNIQFGNMNLGSVILHFFLNKEIHTFNW